TVYSPPPLHGNHTTIRGLKISQQTLIDIVLHPRWDNCEKGESRLVCGMGGVVEAERETGWVQGGEVMEGRDR
ncbi:unnamed protein product, partial [Ilex paraguariensis]